jgi:hypothetical protein
MVTTQILVVVVAEPMSMSQERCDTVACLEAFIDCLELHVEDLSCVSHGYDHANWVV